MGRKKKTSYKEINSLSSQSILANHRLILCLNCKEENDKNFGFSIKTWIIANEYRAASLN